MQQKIAQICCSAGGFASRDKACDCVVEKLQKGGDTHMSRGKAFSCPRGSVNVPTQLSTSVPAPATAAVGGQPGRPGGPDEATFGLSSSPWAFPASASRVADVPPSLAQIARLPACHFAPLTRPSPTLSDSPDALARNRFRKTAKAVQFLSPSPSSTRSRSITMLVSSSRSMICLSLLRRIIDRNDNAC